MAPSQCRPSEPRPDEGDVGDRDLPHGSARRTCRALREREVRLHADRIQLLPQPPLSEVSGGGSQGVAGRLFNYMVRTACNGPTGSYADLNCAIYISFLPWRKPGACRGRRIALPSPTQSCRKRLRTSSTHSASGSSTAPRKGRSPRPMVALCSAAAPSCSMSYVVAFRRSRFYRIPQWGNYASAAPRLTSKAFSPP